MHSDFFPTQVVWTILPRCKKSRVKFELIYAWTNNFSWLNFSEVENLYTQYLFFTEIIFLSVLYCVTCFYLAVFLLNMLLINDISNDCLRCVWCLLLSLCICQLLKHKSLTDFAIIEKKISFGWPKAEVYFEIEY